MGETIFALVVAVIILFIVFWDLGVKKKIETSDIVSYGNGVYYFPFTEEEFGKALSLFIQENPNLQLLSFSGDGTDGYGKDIGYFAVFSST